MNAKTALWVALTCFISVGATAVAHSAKPDPDQAAAAARITSEYRRARLSYEAKRYREAIPIFRDIAENHPKNELAIHAAKQLLDCLHLLNEKEQLLQQADRFLAMPDLLKDPELKKLLEDIKRKSAVGTRAER